MIGDSYYASNFHPNRLLSNRSLSRTWLVMELDSDSIPFPFFTNHWNHLFLKAELKKSFEGRFLHEIALEKVDKLVIGPNLEFNNPNHGFTEDSFSKVNIISNDANFIDFHLWRDIYLIVSESALQFLTDIGAFSTIIEGVAYGKNFEIITNKFLIDCDFEEYFTIKWPTIMNNIEKKRREINDEYRRREGLPPIVR